jgi:tRNA threonylcarbamoyladenosine biosynthesis protein TsaE
MLVEWPQKGQGVLPVADLVLTIDYAGTGRQIKLEAGSESGQKILDSLA